MSCRLIPAGPARFAFVLLTSLPALALAFDVGDRVQASPLSIPSHWQSCVITEVRPGGNYSVACGADDDEYVVQGKWVRVATSGMIQAAPKQAAMASDDDELSPPPRTIGRKMGSTPPRPEADPDDPPEDQPARGEPATAEVGTNAGESLPEGHYECWAAGGVAGTLELNIDSDSEYSDRNGNSGEYVFDAGTREITFESGPWEGFFGKWLTATRIGIASRRGGFYGTSCDLK